MSTPSAPRPSAAVRTREMCGCATGGACTSYSPGHRLHFLQARLASATPSEWLDAVVEDAGADGELVLRTLDGAGVRVWHASRSGVRAGEPVALHARYGVLAHGDRRVSVARVG